MTSNILLLRPDKAGDALKSLPALRALRKEFPSAPVSILVSAHNASVFAHEPGIQLYQMPKHTKKVPKEVWLGEIGLSSLFSKFDKVINLLSDPSDESLQILQDIPAAEKYSARPSQNRKADAAIHWIDFPDDSPAGRDETLNSAHLISQALWIDLEKGIASFDAAPVLTEEDHKEAAEKMGTKRGKWIGFCPFAGTGQRTPPLLRWKKFFQQATQSDTNRFFLLGTPSDYPNLMELRNATEAKDRVELCFPSTFRTLGAYMKRLDGVVAVDSGPLHLARALRVPVLGFLSGGDAERWFPNSSKQDVLIPRGWLSRHPGPRQMHSAFQRWLPGI